MERRKFLKGTMGAAGTGALTLGATGVASAAEDVTVYLYRGPAPSELKL